MGQHYTSGNWRVRSGSEDEFIKRWIEFVEYARDRARGRFFLIRENDDPKHFVSVGIWENTDDISAWMAMPEFQDAYHACGGLCDEYHGAAFSLVTSAGE